MHRKRSFQQKEKAPSSLSMNRSLRGKSVLLALKLYCTICWNESALDVLVW
uniref:Uncharacterized protein n=1 Tax=Parascaris equorum TaxID=6256 RepID=A0A914R8D8_PAREQ